MVRVSVRLSVRVRVRVKVRKKRMYMNFMKCFCENRTCLSLQREEVVCDMSMYS